MARPLAGFGVLATVVVLAREVSIAFGGNETTLALGLAIWAGGLVLGLRRPLRPVAGTGAAAALAAAAAPGLLLLARGLPPLLGSWIPGDPQLGRLVLGALLVLGPAGLTGGTLLRRLGAAEGSPAPHPGILAGAAAGAAAPSLAVALAVPTTGAVALAVAALAGVDLIRGERRWRPVTGLVLAGGLLVLAGPVDRALTGWTHPHLAATAETPRGRLVLDQADQAVTAYREGAFLAASDDPGAAELAHLAATQRDRHDRVLLLGGWLPDLRAHVQPYAPDTVVTVAPSPQLIRLASGLLPDRPPPHVVTLADPRRWLARGDDRFDLILGALPDPVTVAAERSWTTRFFALVASRLRDGGVFAARLHTPQDVWTPRQARRVAAVRQAVQESFAHVQVLPGITTVILAAPRPLDQDPARMAGRLRTGSGTPAVIGPEWLRWRWEGERTAQASALLAGSAVTANSDVRPVSSGDALLRDLGRLLPGLGWHASPRPGSWLGPLIVGAAVLMLLVRRRRLASLAVVSGYSGLAGAVLAVVLLMHLQVRSATLARDLGWLLALLAAGRGLAPWLLSRRQEGVGRWRMPGLLVLISLGSFLVALGLFERLSVPVLATAMLGSGALTAAVARAAAICPGARPGRLLAAELAGAGLGAVLAALLLIPFSGLPATALTVAALAFPAAVTVWPLPGRPGP